jgi:hypothetical protein
MPGEVVGGAWKPFRRIFVVARTRHAQPLVRAYCDEQQISYTGTSLIGSYTAALAHLNQLGAPLRDRAAAGQSEPLPACNRRTS